MTAALCSEPAAPPALSEEAVAPDTDTCSRRDRPNTTPSPLSAADEAPRRRRDAERKRSSRRIKGICPERRGSSGTKQKEDRTLEVEREEKEGDEKHEQSYRRENFPCLPVGSHARLL